MRPKIWLICMLAAGGVGSWLGSGLAMTPQELDAALRRKAPVTVIDIRSPWAYAESHIPGALHIPARIAAKKRLPAFGRVVVCGDGIRTDLTAAAVEALNAVAGIQAEPLEGGFGAWQALNLADTRAPGLARETTRFIVYADFVEALAHNPDAVWVDLRNPDRPGGPPTDLAGRFPRARSIRIPSPPPGRGAGAGVPLGAVLAHQKDQHRNLFVLVDDGDGTAAKAAARLWAAGIRRVVVLAGGETALAGEGRPGSQTIEARQGRP